jgi:hypothetical protein
MLTETLQRVDKVNVRTALKRRKAGTLRLVLLRSSHLAAVTAYGVVRIWPGTSVSLHVCRLAVQPNSAGFGTAEDFTSA